MNVLELLRFLPLIAGVGLIAFLLFRQGGVKDFKLANLIVYFIGIVITLFFVGWLVDTFMFSWANQRLQATTNGGFDTFVDSTEAIIGSSLGNNAPGKGNTSTNVQPPAVIVVTVVPGVEQPPANITGATQYTVVAGDTLYGIASRFNTTVNDLMAVNGLSGHVIQPGQVLLLPSSAP